ncbi:MAG: aminopeptidase P family protein [Deltaproteobacteria bacterium]|nr:aminopeptidase P family protein [Deltaproteobacteria bacterium]
MTSPKQKAFQTKIDAMRAAMKEQGLAGMLFYSSGQMSMLEVNPVLWISGVLPMGPNTGVLLRPSGEATIVISLPWDTGRVRERAWIEDVRVADRFVDELKNLLTREGIKGELGIAGWAFMPAAVYQGIEAIPDVRPKPADAILSSHSRSPGAESLPVLERAARLADIGFSAIVANAKLGMTEYELAAEMEYAMRSHGAEDNFGMLTASDHSHCAHPPQDRRLQPGDIIIAEITPALEGHFIQLCRTAVMGAPTPLLREKFAVLEEAMDKSLEKVRAGKKVGEISQVMNEVFTAHGYEKYCRPPYMRVRGHGLGFWSIPFAEVVDENETVIQPGMSFVVHPNQYIPETGYLMLGDTVWVEENGYRRLTQTPMKLFSVES